MTLTDAPQFDARRERRNRNRINRFLATVESGNLQKAYGLWNNDPDWRQHSAQYAAYDFEQFRKDWGPSGDYGVIKSRRIVVAKSVGNGMVIGVDVNAN